MSLATTVGCIRACQGSMGKGIGHLTPLLYRCYLYWLHAMRDPYQIRGPGHTCLSALRSVKMETIKGKINSSKGWKIIGISTYTL